MLITEKIEKIKKSFMDFFKNLGQSLLEFNDFEAINKILRALIRR